MRVKAIQLIKTEEFPEEHRKWLAKLVTPINDFINQGVAILNNGWVFGDQAVGQDYTWAFTFRSEAISFPLALSWNYKLSARALHVSQALENDTPIAVVVSWQFAQVVSNQALQSQLPQVQLLGVWKLATVTGTPGVQPLTVGASYQIRTRISP